MDKIDLISLDATAQKKQREVIRDPNTFTTGEYAKSVGISRSVAAKRLALLEADGVIARTRVRMLQGDRVQDAMGWKFLGAKAGGDDRAKTKRNRGGRGGEGGGGNQAPKGAMGGRNSTSRGRSRGASTLRRSEGGD